jgi:hypothetical protein
MVQTSSLSKVALCCCMFAALLGCRHQTSQTASIKSANSPVREATHESDVVNKLFHDKPQIISAWRRFNDKSNYRLAQFADFQFSEQAIGRMRGYDSLWREKLNQPYIFGDITRLARSSDLAMIIIDETAEDSRQKLGLIVFNANSDGSVSDAKWVSRNPSLATSTLGWSGNWPAVFVYAPDGSLERLFINWNAARQTYSIDKKQIGPGARNE